MSEPEQPGYLTAYEHIRTDSREDVLERAVEELVFEGYPPSVMLASHLLVGAYVERQGDEMIPGVPRDPEEICRIRGIDLTRDRIGELTIRLGEVIDEVALPEERMSKEPKSSVNASSNLAILVKQVKNIEFLAEEDTEQIAARLTAGRKAAAELDRLDPTASRILQGTANRLRREVADGKKAAAELAERYLPLGIKTAKQFQRPGVDLQDLIGAAGEGLTNLAQRWEPERASFYTFVQNALPGRIMSEIAYSARTIRVPARRWSDIGSLYAAEKTLRSKGIEITDDTIARETKWDSAKVERVQQDRRDIPRTRALFARDDTKLLPEEMDDPELDDTSITGKDISVGFDEDFEIDARLARPVIDAAIATLPAREAEIVRLRFGLTGDDPMPRSKIAEIFGVSVSRIAQIEGQALGKLAHRSKSDKLRGYFDVPREY